MTAMSLFVQPHAAYLLTDTAFYRDDGTVLHFGPKVTEIHFGDPVFGPPSRMAIASTGIIGPDHIQAVLKESGCKDMVDVLDALPVIVRGLDAALPNMRRAPGVTDASILISVAMCDDGGRPFGYIIGNERSRAVEGGHIPPFELVGTRQYVMAHAGKTEPGFEYFDPTKFNASVDAAQLLDNQRADPFGTDECRFTGVGGQGILTEVSPRGVRYHLLRTWDDRLGQRIAA